MKKTNTCKQSHITLAPKRIFPNKKEALEATQIGISNIVNSASYNPEVAAEMLLDLSLTLNVLSSLIRESYKKETGVK